MASRPTAARRTTRTAGTVTARRPGARAVRASYSQSSFPQPMRRPVSGRFAPMGPGRALLPPVATCLTGRGTVALLAAVALCGCGPNKRNTDVPGFIATGKTAEQRAILRSIATYRTTKDTVLACSLITPHFLSSRFEGQADNCEQVQ